MSKRRRIMSCSLNDLSNAKYRFAQTELPSTKFARVLIVSFQGQAEANGTFSFMDAVVAAGKAAWRPSALILDLRKLKYDWGDEMGRTLSDAETSWVGRLPIAIVVSRLNRTGLTSLIKDELFADPEKWLFDSIQEAIAFLDQQKTAP